MDTKALERLQLDFSSLRQRVDSLEVENASLRAALENSGVLKFPESFWADVHRRHFAEVQRQHPCSPERTLGDVLNQQSLTTSIADCLQEAAVCAAVAPCTNPTEASPDAKQLDGNTEAHVAATTPPGLGRSEALEAALEDPKLPPPVSLAPGEADSAIYIFGGNDDAKTLNSCERYCPATNSWDALPSMHQARSAAAAAILDGRVYVCGGNHCGQTLAQVECYDPATGAWEIMPQMVKGRSACSVAALLGKLYVCGGWNGKQALACCERYDPNTRAFSQIAKMAHRREWPVITVDDNQLYLCGGQDGNEDVNIVEAFDPAKAVWETLPLQMQVRRNAAAAVVNSQLFICGGHGQDGRHVLSTVERFMPQTNSWEELTSMQTHRRNAMAIVITGRIYVCGGRGSRGAHNNGGGHALRTVERYDPDTGIWETIPPMAARRYRSASVVLPFKCVADGA